MDTEGVLVGANGLSWDITDRENAKEKIAEALKALQLSEDKFKKLFDTSLDGMGILTSDGKVIDANEAYCKNLGYTRDEVLLLHRDDMLVNTEPGEHIAVRTREEKGSFFGFVKMRKKNGAITDFEVSSSRFESAESRQLVFICCRDITERLKAKQQLIDNEKRFRALIENGRDVITMMDAKGTIFYRSPSYQNVLGFTAEELTGRAQFEDVHSDDVQMLKEKLGPLMSAPGYSADALWRQRHKNGQWLWLEGRGTNLLHDPSVKAIVNNFRDVTEHKLAEDKLAQAHDELNRLFNNIDEVLYSADRNPPRLIQMSASCQKIYGYTAEEFFTNVELWRDVVLPEDEPVLGEIFGTLSKGFVGHGQYRIRHKNGSVRWIDATVTPTLNNEGVLTRVDGVNRDITAQKEADEQVRLSQQRFKALIEKGSDAIAVLGLNKTLLYISPSVEQILGYKPEEVMGQLTADFIHPDDLEVYRPRVYELAANGDSMKVESRIQHKNGHWVWLEVIFTNQINEPAVGGVVANFRDVTESKKALEEIASLNQSLEKKVNERTAELQDANKLLESYNYSVAHDLKAPLRIIAGYAKVLSDTAKERLHDQDRQLLDVIMNTSKKTAQLVSDLLAFSQVKQERIKHEDVDMDKLVLEVVEHVKETDVAPFAKIKLHPMGNSTCDSRLIKQVWVNLVSNAYKYSKQNSEPQVEIGTEITDGKTVYYVKDNGVGFNNEQSAKLFEVFYRIHRDKTFEGTGIGLALAKSVIDHHGGKIWAEGEEGKGATFRFYLPEK